MKEIFSKIQAWDQAQKKFALATVVDTWRSAPRMKGSTMLISEDLEIVGSVSGGCVEGSVIKQAQETLANGEAKLLMFGVSNEDAWSVGLSCGGKIKVFVEPFFGHKKDQKSKSIWSDLQFNLINDISCTLVTKIQESAEKWLIQTDHPSPIEYPSDLGQPALEVLRKRESELIAVDQMPYFLHAFPSKNHLIIIGAAHLSVDLVDLAQQLDFKTTVIDPRGIFADSLKELCRPESLIKAWPEEVLSNMKLDDNVYAVTLTHDPKIDDQALQILLRSDVRYIGSLGSRKTHAKRVSRLENAGFGVGDIDRINGPIGLPIGARTAKEIALSIVAKLIEAKRVL